jgi:hypothetical protein
LGLLKQGELQLLTADGTPLETVQIGDFCGEERFFPAMKARFMVRAATDSEVYIITQYPLLDIPIVHWKLLERCTKRTKLSKSRYIRQKT